MSQLGVTSMALVEYKAGSPHPTSSKEPDAALEMGNISAEEVGQLIHHLQEEIKIIKQQLENLPGYSSGKPTTNST